jgi:hypothetical protein
MIATMKLDENHQYDPNWYIRIDHDLKNNDSLEIVNNLISLTNFVEWDGTDEREMRIMLENEYEHPGYNDYEPYEEDFGDEEPDEEDFEQREA